MFETIIATFKEQTTKAMDHFQHELTSLRTGRANPALLATVMVESYGAHVPLQQVGSVTASDAKTLTISPWDKSQIPAIEKGIMAANLGVTPGNDGVVIRINLPPMTEERRKDLVKLVGQMSEQARIGIRQAREEAIKALKRAEDDKTMGGDEVARGQKKVQELEDEQNAMVKKMAEEKEKEVMTV